MFASYLVLGMAAFVVLLLFLVVLSVFILGRRALVVPARVGTAAYDPAGPTVTEELLRRRRGD